MGSDGVYTVPLPPMRNVYHNFHSFKSALRIYELVQYEEGACVLLTHCRIHFVLTNYIISRDI